jgi:hypothetical protein
MAMVILVVDEGRAQMRKGGATMQSRCHPKRRGSYEMRQASRDRPGLMDANSNTQYRTLDAALTLAGWDYAGDGKMGRAEDKQLHHEPWRLAAGTKCDVSRAVVNRAVTRGDGAVFDRDIRGDGAGDWGESVVQPDGAVNSRVGRAKRGDGS